MTLQTKKNIEKLTLRIIRLRTYTELEKEERENIYCHEKGKMAF